ncbi:MAG: AAA family ATPase, partial [Deltaproteobacteria bacterium]|nr:AAA family ATPase [Deltaproteobacteria bacterium]
MYLEHYKMTAKPFSISADPAFLWLGEKHKEALAVLKYGVLDNKVFLLLTGDVGTGKTTLIHALLKSLGEDVLTASVPDSGLDRMDFYNYIINAFRLNKTFAAKGEFLIYFEKFLRHAQYKGLTVLLIIDEAQRLSLELLEEIRVLSNFERDGTKLLNIFFVGQNEFNDILTDPRNKALRQRITIAYNLKPLSWEEIQTYIEHRLAVAGVSGRELFTESALEAVYRFSGGYPRRINVLCDHALLTGFVRGIQAIEADIIEECAGELEIPGKSQSNPGLAADSRT